MDLVERSSLLEELSGVLAATAAGGRVVLLAGEAGIGKSALVKRFTERQSADARFLLGACDPLLTPRALGPLHDIARQTGGRLAELLASGGHGRPSSPRSWTSSRSPAGGRWPHAAWSARSPRGACQPRSRRADAGRWSAPMPGPTSTASCAGAPNAAAWSWSSGWRWPMPPSSAAGSSVVPGPTIGGTAAPRRSEEHTSEL